MHLISLIDKLWSFIDKLDSRIKTIIIVVIVVLISSYYSGVQFKNILESHNNSEQKKHLEAETYAKDMAPKIDESLQIILDKDPEITNVLLLSYHNSQSSLHGFNYQYLTCINEKMRGACAVQCKQEWDRLSYTYYVDEFQRVYNDNYIIIDSIGKIKNSMPKLYRKLVICEAKSAALYPIVGHNQFIGMIVIIYHNYKQYDNNYYSRVIGVPISKLSTILNYYETINKK